MALILIVVHIENSSNSDLTHATATMPAFESVEMTSLESKNPSSGQMNSKLAGEGCMNLSARASPSNATAHPTSSADLAASVDPPNQVSVSDATTDPNANADTDTNTDGRGETPNNGMRIMNWFDLEFESANTFRPLLDLPWLKALWTRAWFRALATMSFVGCALW